MFILLQRRYVKDSRLFRGRNSPGQLRLQRFKAGDSRAARQLRTGGAGLLRPVKAQVPANGSAEGRHVRVGPEKAQLLFRHSVPLGLVSQYKYRKGIGDIFMEIICPIAADVMGGVGLVASHAGISQLGPAGVV